MNRTGLSGSGFAALLAVLGFGLASPPSVAQPEFIDLGVATGGFSPAYAWGISRDGNVVVLRGTNQQNLYRTYRWTAQTGMVDIGDLIGSNQSWGVGINGDGSVIVGTATHSGQVTPSQGFRWLQSAGGMHSITQGFAGYGWGVSTDGAAAVGEVTVEGIGTRAFRWTPILGLQNLGVPVGGTLSRARGTNADGSVVVGMWTSQASRAGGFRWTPQSGILDLGLLSGGDAADMYACDESGNVVVGYATVAPGVWRAVRWTQAGGLRNLGVLRCGDNNSRANAVSADGSVLVGYSVNSAGGPPPRAFVWTDRSGMIDIELYLRSRGIQLDTWRLTQAVGVSGDGTSLVGFGIKSNGVERSWLVRNLGPLPCSPADVATEGSLQPLTSGPDGFITGTDFDVFVEAFFRVWQLPNGFLVADLTDDSGTCAPDGYVTGSDFDFFIVKFFQGC